MRKRLSFWLLLSAIFAFLLVFNKFFIINDFYTGELKISLEVTSREDDMFQLYYREANGKFKEENSVRIHIDGKDDIQKLHFIIPDSVQASFFRFDFGNYQHVSPVQINEVVLSLNGNRKSITRENLENYFMLNDYGEASDAGYIRKIIGNRSDPFFTSVDLKSEIARLRETPNYTPWIINILLSFLLAGCASWAIAFYNRELKTEQLVTGAFISSFLFILFIPHMDEIANLDDTNSLEKRTMAEPPTIRLETISHYPEAFEAYYNDNFGYRKKMISIWAIFKVKIFNTSPDLNKALVGKDNWLFYWKEDIQNSYLRKKPFTDRGLGSLGSNIIKIHTAAKKADRVFIGTVFPNKHSVYEEMIPARFRKLKLNGIRRKQQFYKYLNRHGIENIPQEEDILREKGERLLYRKYDTHWNSLGAYYGYRNIIRTIHKLDDSISAPLRTKDFEIKVRDDFKHGDLLDLLGIDNRDGVFKDILYQFQPKAKAPLKTKEQAYGKGTVIFENENAGNSKVLLFFGDSYSDELQKFLPLHFNKTIFVRNLRMDQELIDKIDPHFIVYGIVERNLENFR